MSRMHIHIAVEDLAKNIAFYSSLFGAGPDVSKPDYAKWELADPQVNFAISTHGKTPGLDHIGIQAENDAELQAIRQRLEAADIQGVAEEGTTCCYARSDKYWTLDPQGIAWESFHSLESAEVYGQRLDADQADAGCCTPNLSRCC